MLCIIEFMFQISIKEITNMFDISIIRVLFNISHMCQGLVVTKEAQARYIFLDTPHQLWRPGFNNLSGKSPIFYRCFQ